MHILVFSGHPDRDGQGNLCPDTVTIRNLTKSISEYIVDEARQAWVYAALTDGHKVHWVTHSGFGDRVMQAVKCQLKPGDTVTVRGDVPDNVLKELEQYFGMLL